MPDSLPLGLDDWLRALGEIEDEITSRIGANSLKAGAIDVNESQSLEDLYKQKAHAEDMVNRLGGNFPGTCNGSVTNPPGSY